jgi:uncharacterized cupin superfamily protein
VPALVWLTPTRPARGGQAGTAGTTDQRLLACRSISVNPVDTSQGIHVSSLRLQPVSLPPEQLLEGQPRISHALISSSPDGRVERGVWEMTPGVISDVEADELFVAVSGRATIELAEGRIITVEPGDAVILREGERTVWRVSETLRKVYQITHAEQAN